MDCGAGVVEHQETEDSWQTWPDTPDMLTFPVSEISEEDRMAIVNQYNSMRERHFKTMAVPKISIADALPEEQCTGTASRKDDAPTQRRKKHRPTKQERADWRASQEVIPFPIVSEKTQTYMNKRSWNNIEVLLAVILSILGTMLLLRPYIKTEDADQIAHLKAHIELLEDKLTQSADTGSCQMGSGSGNGESSHTHLQLNLVDDEASSVDSLADLQLFMGKTGIGLHEIDKFGNTLLIESARQGHIAVTRLLLASKVFTKQNHVDNEGDTALHKAAYNGHVETTALLLASKVFTKQNHVDNEGDTALHKAAYNGHVETTALLLASKVFTKQNHVDNQGATALHVAAWRGHASVAKALLEHDAFIAHEAKKLDGSSAADLALWFNHSHVADVISAFSNSAAVEPVSASM